MTRGRLGWIAGVGVAIACAGSTVPPHRAQTADTSPTASAAAAVQPDASAAGSASASPSAAVAVSPAPGVDPRDVPSTEAPEAPGEEVPPSPPELGASMQAFAHDLYRELVKSRAPKDTVLFSPLSVAIALTMVYGATAGETAAEFRRALHLPEDAAAPHAWYESWLAWSRLDRLSKDKGLRLANWLWVREGAPARADYLKLLREHYGAGLSTMDAPFNPVAEQQRIKAWVDWRTESRLPELPVRLDHLTVAVLANALVLDLAWAKPFDEKNTKPGQFRVGFRDRAERDFLHGVVPGGYAKRSGLRFASLAYAKPGRSRWTLLLAVPDDERRLAEAERSVTADATATLASLRPVELSLGLPKFKHSVVLELAPHLKDLGIHTPFGQGRFEVPGLPSAAIISQILHGAGIEVNEAGTVVAAATTVTFDGISATDFKRVELIVDRPFAFSLLDTATGVLVATGRYGG